MTSEQVEQAKREFEAQVKRFDAICDAYQKSETVTKESLDFCAKHMRDLHEAVEETAIYFYDDAYSLDECLVQMKKDLVASKDARDKYFAMRAMLEE